MMENKWDKIEALVLDQLIETLEKRIVRVEEVREWTTVLAIIVNAEKSKGA
jgi:hypothetical protein